MLMTIGSLYYVLVCNWWLVDFIVIHYTCMSIADPYATVVFSGLSVDFSCHTVLFGYKSVEAAEGFS